MAKHQRLLTRDLFTGEAHPLKLKSGRGDHVALHRDVGEKRPVAGMAFFPGTGPARKYCEDCAACATVLNMKKAKRDAQGHDILATAPVTEYACRRAWIMLNAPAPGGLRIQSACKYFEPKSASDGVERDYWERHGDFRHWTKGAAA